MKKASSRGRLPYMHPEVFRLLDAEPLSLLSSYSVVLINRRYYDRLDVNEIDDYIDYEDEGEL